MGQIGELQEGRKCISQVVFLWVTDRWVPPLLGIYYWVTVAAPLPNRSNSGIKVPPLSCYWVRDALTSKRALSISQRKKWLLSGPAAPWNRHSWILACAWEVPCILIWDWDAWLQLRFGKQVPKNKIVSRIIAKHPDGQGWISRIHLDSLLFALSKVPVHTGRELNLWCVALAHAAICLVRRKCLHHHQPMLPLLREKNG